MNGEISRRVRAKRLELGMSQEELAEVANISQTAVSRNGRYGVAIAGELLCRVLSLGNGKTQIP